RLVVARLAAGEAYERAHGGVEVLRTEQARAIARELALAIPLEQRELDGEQRHAGEERQVAHAEVEQDDRDRHVRDVPAHDVAKLMGENETLLLLVERIDRPRVHDDEG